MGNKQQRFIGASRKARAASRELSRQIRKSESEFKKGNFDIAGEALQRATFQIEGVAREMIDLSYECEAADRNARLMANEPFVEWARGVFFNEAFGDGDDDE